MTNIPDSIPYCLCRILALWLHCLCGILSWPAVPVAIVAWYWSVLPDMTSWHLWLMLILLRPMTGHSIWWPIDPRHCLYWYLPGSYLFDIDIIVMTSIVVMVVANTIILLAKYILMRLNIPTMANEAVFNTITIPDGYYSKAKIMAKIMKENEISRSVLINNININMNNLLISSIIY